MSDHLELIAAARGTHRPSMSQPPHCVGCALDYPCLYARLADALEQEGQEANEAQGRADQSLALILDSVTECTTAGCEHCTWLGDQVAEFTKGAGELRPTVLERLISAERRAAELETKHEQLKRLYEQCAAQRKDWHTWARSAEKRAAEYQERAYAMMAPCQCDPLQSGEERCNGGCVLSAQIAALEQRAESAEADLFDARGRDLIVREDRAAVLSRDLEAARGRARMLEEWAEQHGHPGYCEDRQVDGGDCICGLAAAIAPQPAAEVPT